MQFYIASQLFLCKIALCDKNYVLAKSWLFMIFLVAFRIVNEGRLQFLEIELLEKVRFLEGCVIFLKGFVIKYIAIISKWYNNANSAHVLH